MLSDANIKRRQQLHFYVQCSAGICDASEDFFHVDFLLSCDGNRFELVYNAHLVEVDNIKVIWVES